MRVARDLAAGGGALPRGVAAVVRRCQQRPGQELFHWQDDAGNLRGVGSGDVNAYLREIAGGDFTAKDFHTWHGTVLALELIRAACGADAAERPGALEILKKVAHRLRNTVAVCRKSYIHPEVLALGKQIGRDDETTAALWARLAAQGLASGRVAAVAVSRRGSAAGSFVTAAASAMHNDICMSAACAV